MQQITYISTARFSEPSQAEVQDILRVSRRNNLRDGLTGLLIVAGRRFLQVLEGPPAFCDAAYSRIRTDPRHFAMVELGRKTITKPSFPGWAMGFEAPGTGDLLEQVKLLTGEIADPNLREHLVSFAQLHRRAA